MDLMTTAEVSEALRTPESTVRYWRHVGWGPRSFNIGPRRVMYRRADVEAWLNRQVTGEAVEPRDGVA